MMMMMMMIMIMMMMIMMMMIMMMMMMVIIIIMINVTFHEPSRTPSSSIACTCARWLSLTGWPGGTEASIPTCWLLARNHGHG